MDERRCAAAYKCLLMSTDGKTTSSMTKYVLQWYTPQTAKEHPVLFPLYHLSYPVDRLDGYQDIY